MTPETTEIAAYFALGMSIAIAVCVYVMYRMKPYCHWCKKRHSQGEIE